MFYLIYKITNTLNNKEYIGAHQTENINDDYMGSGKLLKRAYKKYGKENFKKEIIHTCTSLSEMYTKEAELVNSDYILRKDTYNLKEGGIGGAGKRTEETKKKISQTTKGENAYWFGKSHSEETKEKIREARKLQTPWNKGIKTGKTGTMLGKQHDDETRARMSAKALERPKVECPHCHRLVDKCTSKRWHFDNCKLRIIP